MALLQDTAWEEPLLKPRRDRVLERWARQHMGMVPPGMDYLAACPEIVHMYYEIDFAPLVHIGRDLAGLIALVVSQDNSCRYCYAGVRVLLNLMGVPGERIQKLEHTLQTARHDSRLEPALDFARRVSRANPLPSALEKKALAETGYRDEAIRELAFHAVKIGVANRMATLPALPPRRPELLADGRVLRVLRPLLAWRLAPILHRSGKADFLPDDLKRGHYKYVVLALEGLPSARVLRNALDDAWASPHTTSRAKALVFGVVARGLGSRHSEREAFRLLANEGLGEAQTEQILANLDGPELDPVERVILPYARETLWYEPAAIQRRGRALLRQLSGEQFVELIGVASLANMVGRLDVILDDP